MLSCAKSFIITKINNEIEKAKTAFYRVLDEKISNRDALIEEISKRVKETGQERSGEIPPAVEQNDPFAEEGEIGGQS